VLLAKQKQIFLSFQHPETFHDIRSYCQQLGRGFLADLEELVLQTGGGEDPQDGVVGYYLNHHTTSTLQDWNPVITPFLSLIESHLRLNIIQDLNRLRLDTVGVFFPRIVFLPAWKDIIYLSLLGKHIVT
jgi:hypothetical protein